MVISISPLTPPTMMLVLGLFLALLYLIINKKCRNGYKEYAILIFLISFAFCIMSFAAFMGSYFYQLMGYNVTEQNTITASDASNTLLSSVLAVVIGYLFFNNDKKR